MKSIISYFKENKESVIRISYIIPILIAAGISVYHVVAWYGIMNPMAWAIYLSVGVEIAALSALAGMTAKMNKFIYVPFLIVTFIQLVGNIFATFEYIDVNSQPFKDWMMFSDSIFESMGILEAGDVMAHRRVLAILGGLFIPIISLSFLHMIVSFNERTELENVENTNKEDSENDSKNKKEEKEEEINNEIIEKENIETNKESISNTTEEINIKDIEEHLKNTSIKLENDKKVFLPLLEILFDKGNVGKGDIMPDYLEFKEKLNKDISEDNIKRFLTVCNYLKITNLSDNTRTAQMNYEDAKKVLEKYYTFETDEIENSTKNNSNPKESIEKTKDWWMSNNKI
jgi:hypothetical protein